MSKSVWVIERGEYSNYRVVGVYTSRRNAQAVVDKIKSGNSWTEPTIAKWELDPGIDDINAGREPYYVTMAPDGTVERCERADWEYQIGEGLDVWPRTKAAAYRGKGIPDAVRGTVWATDDKHAIKIANETRLQWLESGKLKP